MEDLCTWNGVFIALCFTIGGPGEYIVFDFCASFRQVYERFMGMVNGCLDLPLRHARTHTRACILYFSGCVLSMP